MIADIFSVLVKLQISRRLLALSNGKSKALSNDFKMFQFSKLWTLITSKMEMLHFCIENELNKNFHVNDLFSFRGYLHEIVRNIHSRVYCKEIVANVNELSQSCVKFISTGKFNNEKFCKNIIN